MMIALYVVSLLLGLGGAWFILSTAPRLGLVDHPNDRSSHAEPTPKGGGIGIFAAFIFMSFYLRIPFAAWASVAFVAAFSLIADRFEIRPVLRLCAQVIAALIFILSIKRFFGPYFFIPAVVFVVGSANFYNFMDGINGIAAITGIVGFGFLSAFSFAVSGNAVCGTIALCAAFSCLGFLPFNFPKARVFMGDVGSILLGFLFAGLVVWISRDIFDFICLASFMFPFYADELTTMYVRIRDGEDLTKPHRKHLYQILANELSVPHWKVSIMYGVAQLVISVSALLLRQFGVIMALMLGAYFIVFCLVSFSVRRSV